MLSSHQQDIAETLRHERAGFLTLTEEFDFADLDDVQPHQAVKKQAITSRLAAMHEAGAMTPSFTRLRLEAAAATTDEATRQANRAGMRTRLEAEDNREPAVVVPPVFK